MRKGEEKRQELLAVAERLFCTKGYDNTSVQDILDVLHVSKGGFYHYFVSKEAVLETLCYLRAERACRQANVALGEVTEPMDRINCILRSFLPLRREETGFMSMLMPLMDSQEGRSVRAAYQDALTEVFLPLLQCEMDEAKSQGVIFPPAGDVGCIVLNILNQCWADVALALLNAVKKTQQLDAAALLSQLNLYRRSIECLLDAPYGSIELIKLSEWDEVAQRVTRRMLLPMEG